MNMEKKIFKHMPISDKIILHAGRTFFPFASAFLKKNKNLEKEISESSIEISPVEYISGIMVSGIFGFFMFFAVFIFLGNLFRPVSEVLLSSVFIAILFGIIFVFQPIALLKIESIRKIKLMEKDLLFALKYIYIRIKSGISLYDAMIGIAYGDFGEVSKEFKKTIKEISGGIEEVHALENMALRNPSPYFRRVVWQITNNLRAGTDIANVLESITSSLVNEHKLLIRRYGSELNPIILMYMMLTIVIPSLGITVVVVMSAFSGITVPIYLFYLIPIMLLALQFMFISLIRTKRPLMVL